MQIQSRPLGLVVMALALLGSGCAAMHPGQGVETVDEKRRAIPEPQKAATENEAPVVMETPATDPVEVVLQVQELYFQHEGIGTQRDANGNLHLLVTDDSLCFIFGQAQLKPKSAIPLRHLATVLIGYPESRLTISGHTDNVGPEQLNVRLSQERANALRGALLLYGVSPKTIASVTGYGEAHPIADNRTVGGRAMNRRVDLRIAIDRVEAAANQQRREAAAP